MHGMPPSAEEESFRRLGLGLKGRASTAAESEVGASFDARIDDSLDLADHSEALVGFENLASNVYEFRVGISDEELRTFENLAAAWGVQSDRWEYVRQMVHEQRSRLADRRAIVEALIAAIDRIDEINTAVRSCDDRRAALEVLVQPPLEFNEMQAQHVLDLTIARQTKQSRADLAAEAASIAEEIDGLNID
ncbi:MAG: gyrase subunit [Acidimicrobiaceae bacterium]|nr:gyrase subunit [Acidimicrobiaceae bacterium]